MFKFLIFIFSISFSYARETYVAIEPSEENCRDYKDQIAKISDDMMNISLDAPFQGNNNQNYNTLGELQKQQAKLMAELVLINAMKEMNARSLAALGPSDAIQNFEREESNQQITMIPNSPVFRAAMDSYLNRTQQLAVHQLLNETLNDMSLVDTSVIRNTANATQAANLLIEQICRRRQNSRLCTMQESETPEHRNILSGLLENYVTAVKNSNENNPTVTPQQLNDILNEQFPNNELARSEFLSEYNTHYRNFDQSLSTLYTGLGNCSGENCNTIKRTFMNQYNEFTDNDSEIIADILPELLPTNKINERLNTYFQTAKVAARNANNQSARGFNAPEEMRPVLDNVMSIAFPNMCSQQNSCSDLVEIKPDGNIQLRGTLGFEVHQEGINRRIQVIREELMRMNQAIEQVKGGNNFKVLNSIVNYMSNPFSYHKFCESSERISATATCNYNQNGQLTRIGKLLTDGGEVLAHTYQNTPRMQISYLQQFCESRERNAGSRSAFVRDWGATCALAQVNTQIEESSSASLERVSGIFDPRTGQRYEIEQPPTWQVVTNGVVAGLLPKFGGLVTTYYQSQYMDMYLANTPSHWIVPPRSYYYGYYSSLFDTSWSSSALTSGTAYSF